MASLSVKEAVCDVYAPCSECRSLKIIFDQRQGRVVCTDCGLVQEDQVFDERMVFAKEGSNDPGRAAYRSQPPLFEELGVECTHAGCITRCKVRDSRMQVWNYIRALGSRMGLLKRVIDIAGQFWKDFCTHFSGNIAHKYHYAMACVRLACMHDGMSFRTLQEIRKYADPALRPVKPHTRVAKLVNRIKPYTQARFVTWKERACRIVCCILARLGMSLFEPPCRRLVCEYHTAFVVQHSEIRSTKTPRVVASSVVFALSWYYNSPRCVSPTLSEVCRQKQMALLKAVRADHFSQFASKTAVTQVAGQVYRTFLEGELKKPKTSVCMKRWVQTSTRQRMTMQLESAQSRKRQKTEKHVTRENCSV